MSATIDENDKIWNIFLGYTKLIDNKAASSGIDMYGTEQRTTLAMGLTQAHMTAHVVCKLKDMEKQAAQMRFTKDLKKEVETGKHGTQKYMIKQGINKGKIL